MFDPRTLYSTETVTRPPAFRRYLHTRPGTEEVSRTVSPGTHLPPTSDSGTGPPPLQTVGSPVGLRNGRGMGYPSFTPKFYPYYPTPDVKPPSGPPWTTTLRRVPPSRPSLRLPEDSRPGYNHSRQNSQTRRSVTTVQEGRTRGPIRPPDPLRETQVPTLPGRTPRVPVTGVGRDGPGDTSTRMYGETDRLCTCVGVPSRC